MHTKLFQQWPNLTLVLLGLLTNTSQGTQRQRMYFSEQFHNLRKTVPAGAPECHCEAAGRSCSELLSFSFYLSKSSVYVQRMGLWRSQTGYHMDLAAEHLQELPTQRYSQGSTALLYDLYGCDCSACNPWLDHCSPLGVTGCWSPLGSGDSCRPRCNGAGEVPFSPEVHCERGVLHPPKLWCYAGPPLAPVQALRFVDNDPRVHKMAGELTLHFPRERPWAVQASLVRMYLGMDTAKMGQPIFEQALQWNQQGPLQFWFNITEFHVNFTSLLACLANGHGDGPCLMAPRPADLVVEPGQPQAAHPFRLRAFRQSGASKLHLTRSSSCVGGQGIWPSKQDHFQVLASGLYTVCDDSHIALGQVAVSGGFAQITGENGRSLTPVVGSPFVLELNGSQLGEGHHLSLVPASISCGGLGATTPSGLAEVDPSVLNGGGRLQWQVVSHSTGAFKACLYVGLCGEYDQICRQVRRESAVSVGVLEVLACETPCRTCGEHPQVCTSCMDPDSIPQSGVCWPKWRWCAGSSNASNCTTNWQVPLLATPAAEEGIRPGALAEEFQCASEPRPSDAQADCVDCTMNRICRCHGVVKYGRDLTWTPWRNVSGAVECSSSLFDYDPLPGRAKVCVCRPSDGTPLPSLGGARQRESWTGNVSGPRSHCPCSVKGFPQGFVRAQNYFMEDACGDDNAGDCGSETTPLRLIEPVSLAVLGPRTLLLADKSHHITKTVPGRLISSGDIPKGAVFLMDLATGDLRYACPSCCSKYLYEPRSVRVSASGAFWVMADSRNHRIRRVDTTSMEVTDVAGAGPQRCMNVYPDATTWPREATGVRLATEARLCRTMDVAIHKDEKRFLILETDCLSLTQPPEVGRVELIDERGHIHLVVTLPLTEGGCTQAPTSLEWLAAEQQQFVVACGNVKVFSLAGEDETASLFRAESIRAVHMVRGALHSDELLMAGHGGKLTVVPLRGGALRELLGQNSSSLTVDQSSETRESPVKRESGVRWVSETLVESVPGAAYTSDGALVLLAVQRGRTEVLIVRPACRPGEGAGPGGACHTCPPGKFSNGSPLQYGRCLPCSGELEDSDAGATRCGCRAGFKRSRSSLPCEACQAGNYCPRGQEAARRCPGGATSFNGSEPGNSEAHSLSQCDCCYGQYRSGEVCLPCPEGRWCGGSRGQFSEAPFRLRNGYWLPNLAAATEASVTFKCKDPSLCWWTPYPRLWAAYTQRICRLASRLEVGSCSALHCAGVLAALVKPKQAQEERQEGEARAQAVEAKAEAEAKAEVPEVWSSALAWVCAGGREGLACGRCPVGSWAPGRLSGCLPCRGTWLLVATATVLALLGLLLLAGLCSNLEARVEGSPEARQHSTYALASCLGIMLVFSDHLFALHHLLDMRWPLPQQQAMDGLDWALSVALAYLSPVPSACLGEGSAAASLASSVLLLPTALLLLLLLLGALARAGRRFRVRAPLLSGLEASVSSDSSINLSGLLASVLVCPLTSAALGIFQCYQHPGSSREWMSLRWSPDVLCSSGSRLAWPGSLLPHASPQAWQQALPIGILGLALPVSWLGLQVLLVRHLPAKLLAKRGAERRQKHCLLVRTRFAWRRLRGLCWDLVSLARVSLLHLLVILQPFGIPLWALLFAIFLVTLISLLAGVVQQPYSESVANTLHTCTTSALLLILAIGILTLDDSRLDPLAQRFMTTAMMLAASGFTVIVTCTAVRDLLMPSWAQEQETRSVEALTEHIQGMIQVHTDQSLQTHVLNELIEDLDTPSLERAMQSLHYLEQMMVPAKYHRDTRWTRLAAIDRPEKVEQELEKIHQRNGNTQAGSEGYKSRSAGIAAVISVELPIAEDAGPAHYDDGGPRSPNPRLPAIGAEGSLISIRHTPPRQRNSLMSLSTTVWISFWRALAVGRSDSHISSRTSSTRAPTASRSTTGTSSSRCGEDATGPKVASDGMCRSCWSTSQPCEENLPRGRGSDTEESVGEGEWSGSGSEMEVEPEETRNAPIEEPPEPCHSSRRVMPPPRQPTAQDPVSDEEQDSDKGHAAAPRQPPGHHPLPDSESDSEDIPLQLICQHAREDGEPKTSMRL